MEKLVEKVKAVLGELVVLATANNEMRRAKLRGLYIRSLEPRSILVVKCGEKHEEEH